LVEDDQFHAAYLSDAVTEALPEVSQIVLARDGAEGEALARRDRIEAVVMDLQMPGRNGIDTLSCAPSCSRRRSSWTARCTASSSARPGPMTR